MEWIRDEFLLTDDINRLDLARTKTLLGNTYWGVRRPAEVIDKMIKHSMSFVLLHRGQQIGFGRAVTDYTVFTWVADIVIDESYRGQGLGKWMMSCITQHPLLCHTQMVLQTRDAHSLYEKYGFSQNPALMSTRVDGL